MTLDDRLKSLLAPLGAEAQRMFGGTCYMINGNMLIGTLKGGLIVRVGKDAHAAAMKRPGARVFDMNGRVSEGFIRVGEDFVETDASLAGWVQLAQHFVATLPGKPVKPKNTGKRGKKPSSSV